MSKAAKKWKELYASIKKRRLLWLKTRLEMDKEYAPRTGQFGRYHQNREIAKSEHANARLVRKLRIEPQHAPCGSCWLETGSPVCEGHRQQHGGERDALDRRASGLGHAGAAAGA